VRAFPRDYDFRGLSPHHACGMSVPPVMMARVAQRVRDQWLDPIDNGQSKTERTTEMETENKKTERKTGMGTSPVDMALGTKEGRVLITACTKAYESEIKKAIIEENRCVPANITVQTWHSFLFRHGVRPFQSVPFDGEIKGVAENKRTGRVPEEEDFEGHYFSKDMRIYRDKLSKFACRCDKKSNGWVTDRISRIYPHIFVDEARYMAGHDLEFIRLLSERVPAMTVVG